MIVTKYTNTQVKCVNLFTLYVIHHNGITQKPRDHLFQKLWHLGATKEKTGKQAIIDKFDLFSL